VLGLPYRHRSKYSSLSLHAVNSVTRAIINVAVENARALNFELFISDPSQLVRSELDFGVNIRRT